LVVAVVPAVAAQYQLAATGTITTNASTDTTIPVGTPWSFELTYDTAAPDLDFEVLGAAEPTYGRFKNTATPPALVAFHYQAGDYEVTLDDPAEFAAASEMLVTFTSINAIDINIHAGDLFPPLAGGPVGFHADFNAFDAAPVLTSDGLPTDVSMGTHSFDESTVTLLPMSGFISGSTITSFSITAVPEPGAIGLAVVGSLVMFFGPRQKLSI
jgi:hypothetical protein